MKLEETTMKIKFSCCFCGHKLKAAAALAGRRGKCPRCDKTVRVPSLGTPAVPTAIPVGGVAIGPVLVATAVPAKAAGESSSTLVPATLRLKGFRQDKTFWLRIGGGAAGLLILLAVLTLLTMG
jgi:hypothetical protein